MKSFVVGGAGFIGSHLVDRLVDRGPVTVFDDLSVGQRAFVSDHLDGGRANLVEADARELDVLVEAMADHDVVFHLSANPEARAGLSDTRLDLEQGTIATWNVLEAMRRRRVGELVFASSGTVYGDTALRCAESDLGALPISLYGASKLAGEALVSAFCHCFELSASILRFGNVVGPRGTHGAALDFLRKLDDDPHHLEVLGDGRQEKPYLHVEDCCDGMMFVHDHRQGALDVLNLAPPDRTSVSRLAELCVAASPTDAAIHYTGGDRGWPGDVPRSSLAPDALIERGFRLRHDSDQAVTRAVEALALEIFGDRARPIGGPP